MQIRQEMNSPSPYLTESLITGEPQEKPGKYDDVVLGFVAVRDFPGMRILERLAMYERRFELSLYKTMAEFKKLQQIRKAQDAKFKARAIPPLGKATTPYIGNETATHLEKQSQFARSEFSVPRTAGRSLTKQIQSERQNTEERIKNKANFSDRRQNTPLAVDENNKLCGSRVY